jgi:hypothetical protein
MVAPVASWISVAEEAIVVARMQGVGSHIDRNGTTATGRLALTGVLAVRYATAVYGHDPGT